MLLKIKAKFLQNAYKEVLFQHSCMISSYKFTKKGDSFFTIISQRDFLDFQNAYFYCNLLMVTSFETVGLDKESIQHNIYIEG